MSASQPDDGGSEPVDIDLRDAGSTEDARETIRGALARGAPVRKLSVDPARVSYKEVAKLVGEFPRMQSAQSLLISTRCVATDLLARASYNLIYEILRALPNLWRLDVDVYAANVNVNAFLAVVNRLDKLEYLSFKAWQDKEFKDQAFDALVSFVRTRRGEGHKTPLRTIVPCSLLLPADISEAGLRRLAAFENALADLRCNFACHTIVGLINSDRIRDLIREKEVIEELAMHMSVEGVPELIARYARQSDAVFV